MWWNFSKDRRSKNDIIAKYKSGKTTNLSPHFDKLYANVVSRSYVRLRQPSVVMRPFSRGVSSPGGLHFRFYVRSSKLHVWTQRENISTGGTSLQRLKNTSNLVSLHRVVNLLFMDEDNIKSHTFEEKVIVKVPVTRIYHNISQGVRICVLYSTCIWE